MNVQLNKDAVSGLCDIIGGTIDSCREWGSECDTAEDVMYWLDIMFKLDPESATALRVNMIRSDMADSKH